MDEIERINLLKIPLDIVPEESLGAIINGLLQSKGGHIVLLSVWDLLKARRNSEYRHFVQNAALVIPISKSLISGAKFLSGKTPQRYMPFNFVVRLLSIIEESEYTVYLLGGAPKVLSLSEKHIRQTFPRVKIIGRHSRKIRRHDEPILIESIRKVSPSLLLANRGLRGGEKWLMRHQEALSESQNPGLRLWCSDLFEVFADKRSRPADKTFERGLEWFGYCCRSPIKFLRFFSFFYYKILLLCYRLFKKPAKDTIV
jgi:N-acetylglucosaminyldiphosphoundecaprenol N-acetyl-beta-D-mannosaminyltransferase